MSLVADTIFEGYRLIQPIGNGKRVWRALQDRASLECVIKFEPDEKKANREIRVLRTLIDNPHAPTLIDSFSSAHGLAIVTHQVPGARLDLLKLSKNEKLQVLSDAASFIGDLAELGSFHGDLKESNIHWDGANTFFLDFGYAFDPTLGGSCSPESRTPEHAPDRGDVGTASDVMAWGRLAKALRPDIANHFQDCLSKDPNKRPLPKEVFDRLESIRKRRLISKPISLSLAVVFIASVAIWGLVRGTYAVHKPNNLSLGSLDRPMAIFLFDEPSVLYEGGNLAFVGDTISGLIRDRSITGKVSAIGINGLSISHGVEVSSIAFPKPESFREYNYPFPVVVHGSKGNMMAILRGVAALAGFQVEPKNADGSIAGVFKSKNPTDFFLEIAEDLGIYLDRGGVRFHEREIRLAVGVPDYFYVTDRSTLDILKKFEPLVGEISLKGENKEWPVFIESGWRKTLDMLNLEASRLKDGTIEIMEVKDAKDL